MDNNLEHFNFLDLEPCTDRGYTVFTDPSQIDIEDLGEGDRQFTKIFRAPSIGEVETFFILNQRDYKPNDLEEVFYFDSEGKLGKMRHNDSIKMGYHDLSISLIDADPYKDAQMQASVWLEGKSPKISAPLKTYKVDQVAETNNTDEVYGKTTFSGWKVDTNPTTTYGVVFKPDFDQLKDLRVSFEGITKEGGDN